MAYDNVKVKPRQKVAPSSQTKDLGIVTNVPMGEWNATTPYMKLNMVRSHNATYQAKKNNQGVEPTVTAGWQEVWQVVAYDGRGISSTLVTYQGGISNTIVPSGEWESDIPNVPQGQYLWTRTVYNFTDGTQTVSYTVSLQTLGFTQQDRDNIERITDAIPSSASEDNPLTTKDFVNSSINNLAAFYITPTAAGDEAWATRASLINATTFYNAGEARVPTTNDYAIVLADESQPVGVDGTHPTTRYSYQGGTYPNGQWDYQYTVNDTSFTQAQINAINSGITAQKIAEMDSANAAKYTKPSSGVPESDLSSAVQKKLNKTIADLMGSTAIGNNYTGIYYDGTKFVAQDTSFANASWEKIAEISASGQANKYFKVGDEKTITLTTGEEITLVILGFNHDELYLGGGKAGITIGMKGVLSTKYAMNATNTNSGGWGESNMRLTVMNLLLAQLPTAMKSYIKQVKKAYQDPSTSAENILYSGDKLFLLSQYEVSGSTSYSRYAEGTMYPYFRKLNGDVDTTKYNKSYSWWLRSADLSSNARFAMVASAGIVSRDNASAAYGVSFACCI